ncbi:phospholipase D-like domain-containing protein [Cronobacter turicensis]
MPQNPVAEWLGERIKRAILSHMVQPFHVYIVLPVHPEGRLDDPSIVAQIHLTRQSLIFGSRSLLNLVRRSLWVRQQLELQATPRKEWAKKIKELEGQSENYYTDIPMDACNQYVTLLNLRDHAQINGMVVTEQIYVHSKLTIVDDRYVLIGSANINDRSLDGDRDSELAVLISDTEHGYTDLDGSGNSVPYRNFARELRKKAWRKWLGSAADECTEVMNKPASPSTWKKIQKLAIYNTKIYEDIFDFIPRNTCQDGDMHNESYHEDNGSETTVQGSVKMASIWPIATVNNIAKEEKMPFSITFWEEYKNSGLINTKGFIHQLPLHWTEGENNLIPYNMRVIADNNLNDNDQTLIAQNEEQKLDGLI